MLIFFSIIVLVAAVFIHAVITQDIPDTDMPSQKEACIMCNGAVTRKNQSKYWHKPCHEWCETYY